MKKAIVIALVVTLALTGCASTKDVTSKTSETTQVSDSSKQSDESNRSDATKQPNVTNSDTPPNSDNDDSTRVGKPEFDKLYKSFEGYIKDRLEISYADGITPENSKALEEKYFSVPTQFTSVASVYEPIMAKTVQSQRVIGTPKVTNFTRTELAYDSQASSYNGMKGMPGIAFYDAKVKYTLKDGKTETRHAVGALSYLTLNNDAGVMLTSYKMPLPSPDQEISEADKNAITNALKAQLQASNCTLDKVVAIQGAGKNSVFVYGVYTDFSNRPYYAMFSMGKTADKWTYDKPVDAITYDAIDKRVLVNNQK